MSIYYEMYTSEISILSGDNIYMGVSIQWDTNNEETMVEGQFVIYKELSATGRVRLLSITRWALE